MNVLTLSALAIVGAAAQSDIYTATGTSAVYAAQATAATSHETSHVCGKAFDRFITIWLENTDYDKAAGDPNLSWLASKGITLTNYFGVTHPSEPNYVASHGGDNCKYLVKKNVETQCVRRTQHTKSENQLGWTTTTSIRLLLMSLL